MGTHTDDTGRATRFTRGTTRDLPGAKIVHRANGRGNRTVRATAPYCERCRRRHDARVLHIHPSRYRRAGNASARRAAP